MEGFPLPYQFKNVKAGMMDVIYRFKVPEGRVGFIASVGNSWHPNTYLLWYVDGELVEKVQRIISPVKEPLKYLRGEYIVVEDYVEWKGVNEDGVDHLFEVFCDGLLYPSRKRLEYEKVEKPLTNTQGWELPVKTSPRRLNFEDAISISLYNDGPDTVEVSIDGGKFSPVKSGGTLDVDLSNLISKYPDLRIRFMDYRSLTSTATIRVTALKLKS